jgi:hypothetical protein
VKPNVSVARATVAGQGLKLELSDGTTEDVDLVVLATGYRINITKYQIIDSALQQQIQKTADGYPVLDVGLQTSVNGLYMAGVIGERTLGPTLRFVTGTSNAGPRLAASITSHLRSTAKRRANKRNSCLRRKTTRSGGGDVLGGNSSAWVWPEALGEGIPYGCSIPTVQVYRPIFEIHHARFETKEPMVEVLLREDGARARWLGFISSGR